MAPQYLRQRGLLIVLRLRLVVQKQRRHPPPAEAEQHPLPGDLQGVLVHHAQEHRLRPLIGGEPVAQGQYLPQLPVVEAHRLQLVAGHAAGAQNTPAQGHRQLKAPPIHCQKPHRHTGTTTCCPT